MLVSLAPRETLKNDRCCLAILQISGRLTIVELLGPVLKLMIQFLAAAASNLDSLLNVKSLPRLGGLRYVMPLCETVYFPVSSLGGLKCL